ncbi:hypothetical protein [Leifsonia aquatica]|uniref:hypothetical protein n=1 Tax=Leifsonia aquatica TaxID=144185 RepID=UPI0004681D7F|nr:hypothetical protein [Leifsonia aquatica]
MVEQRSAGWVAKATPDQIHEALHAGELAVYMGGKTDSESAQEAHVKGTPDRLYAEAFGFDSYAQMKAVVNAHGSTMVTAIRQGMSPDQLAKLDWLESASPEEAYAAEKAGELNLLLGRGNHKGTEGDGIIRSAGSAASNSDISEVEASAEYQAAVAGDQ